MENLENEKRLVEDSYFAALLTNFLTMAAYYLLLSGTVVGENPDHVCWVFNVRHIIQMLNPELNNKITHSPKEFISLG